MSGDFRYYRDENASVWSKLDPRDGEEPLAYIVFAPGDSWDYLGVVSRRSFLTSVGNAPPEFCRAWIAYRADGTPIYRDYESRDEAARGLLLARGTGRT